MRDLSSILFTAVLMTVLLSSPRLSQYLIGVIVTYAVLFILNLYSLIRRNKIYLKSISINENKIEVVAVKRDEEFVVVQSDLENSRIRVFELFFATGFGRNFKLLVDNKQNGKFVTVFEQREIGKWDLETFKEIYTIYCKAKNIPCSLASLKRSNF